MDAALAHPVTASKAYIPHFGWFAFETKDCRVSFSCKREQTSHVWGIVPRVGGGRPLSECKIGQSAVLCARLPVPAARRREACLHLS